MANNKFHKRFKKKIIFSFYFFGVLLVAYRFYGLQIIEYKKYKSLGDKNSISPIVLNAHRGIIYDTKGKPIVDNKFIYDINIIPQNFQNDSFNYRILFDVAKINKAFIDSIITPYKKTAYRYKPQLIKRHIDFQTKSILDENKLELQGMYFSNFPIRTYTDKCNLSHTIGHLRQDRNGDIISFNGIEKKYENLLKGNNGVEYHFVDSRGIDQGDVHFEENKNLQPVQGKDLFLTIDLDLQEYCENLIKEESGSIIVSNSSNGEILSILSFPDYDLKSFTGPISNSEWEKLNNKDNIFLNISIQSTYPPGSIFKLILAAIVLENKIISNDWRVNCTGVYDFFDTKFRCWKKDGHGTINLNQAIQKSCNIYFYNLMQKIDFELWSNEVKKFGFGNMTGIDLPSEKNGLVPNRAFMNDYYRKLGGWSKGHLLNLAIGQGETLVTPIQINSLMNIIVNEGNAFIPHLSKNLKGQEKQYQYINYNSKVWDVIKSSMYDAVNKAGGTAYNAKLNLSTAKVYGKTGTVQLCSNCDISPHAWFGGFVEFENNRKYSVSIIIENGGKGSNIPATIAKKIFEFIATNDI